MVLTRECGRREKDGVRHGILQIQTLVRLSVATANTDAWFGLRGQRFQ